MTAATSLPPEDAQQGPAGATSSSYGTFWAEGISNSLANTVPAERGGVPLPFLLCHPGKAQSRVRGEPPQRPCAPSTPAQGAPPSDALRSALAPARKSTPSLSQSRHQLPRFPLPASPGMADGTGDRLSDAHPLRVKCVYTVVCTSVFPSLSPTFLFCFVFL